MKGLTVTLLMMISIGTYADWVSVEDFVETIPHEYVQAWNERNEYDEVFYKMMQLKRGIAKDDRVVIMGKSSGIPAKQDDGNWAVIFNTLDAYGRRYAGGAVL